MGRPLASATRIIAPTNVTPTPVPVCWAYIGRIARRRLIWRASGQCVLHSASSSPQYPNQSPDIVSRVESDMPWGKQRSSRLSKDLRSFGDSPIPILGTAIALKGCIANGLEAVAVNPTQ